MTIPSVRALLIDIDDTLVDTRGAFRHALAVVGKEYLPQDVKADDLVRVWRTDIRGWYRAYTRGEVSYRDQRMRRANELHEIFGAVVMDDAAYDEWDERFEAAFQEGWRAHEDALPLLDALDEAGVVYGAVSNAAVEYQAHKLAAVGLARVPMLVGTDTFGVGKPDPRVFAEGARRLGVEAGACAYVGDELDIDARAAVAAGLGLGVWLDRAVGREDGHAGSSTPTQVWEEQLMRVESLQDLAAWFGKAAELG